MYCIGYSPLCFRSVMQIVKVKHRRGFGVRSVASTRRRQHSGGDVVVKGIRGKKYYPEGVEIFLLPLT